jgi:hypothetical protein
MATHQIWLHIGANSTELAQHPAVVLRVGSEKIAREHFRHEPPTPLELENAIAAVEDEIARVHEGVRPGSRLYTRDAAVRDIALAVGVKPAAEMELALDAVEHAFERLPLRPMAKEDAAALLILRELMHHLGYAAISVCGG